MKVAGGGGGHAIIILDPVVKLTPTLLTFEADRRRVDLLARSMGLTAANSLGTPGVKGPNAE